MQTLEAHTEGKTIAGGYRVERFSVDKLNDLVYLHMAVYDKLLSRDFLLKKYKDDGIIFAEPAPDRRLAVTP